MMRSRRDTGLLILLLVLILGIAAALRFYELDMQSLWADEGNSAALATRSLGRIAQDAANDIHPPLYYWLLHLWTSVFGYSEAGLRSLSAVLGVLLVLATAEFGRRVYHSVTGLLAGLIAAIAPFQVYYSQEARMYILLALEAAVAMLLFWWLLSQEDHRLPSARTADLTNSPKGQGPARIRWLPFSGQMLVLTWTAGLYTHYAFPLIIALSSGVYALWLIATRRRGCLGSRVLRWLILLAITFGLYAPWLPTAVRQLVSWPAPSASAALFEQLPTLLATVAFGTIPVNGLLPWVTLLFALALLGALPWPYVSRDHQAGGRRMDWLRGVLPLTWLLAPILMILALGLFRGAYLKFLIIASPAFALLLARSVTGPVGWLVGWSPSIPPVVTTNPAAPDPAQEAPVTHGEVAAGSAHNGSTSTEKVLLGAGPDPLARSGDALPAFTLQVSSLPGAAASGRTGDPSGPVSNPLRGPRAAEKRGRRPWRKGLSAPARGLLTVGWVSIALAVIFTAAAGGLARYYNEPSAARDDYRGISQFIFATGQPNDGILLDAPGQSEVFDYYYKGDLPIYPLPRQRPLDPVQTQAELEQLLRHDKVYALYWGAEEADPEGIIEHWLDQRGYKTLDHWHGNVRLAVYVMPEFRAPDEQVDNLDARLENGITLQGYEGWNLAPTAGEVTQVQLQWRADQQPDRRFKVFLQLLDPRNQVIAQRDAEPAGESRPTTSWQPGETVPDNHGVLIPPGTPPGSYRRIVGMYDAETFERLKLADGTDFINLPPIAVHRAKVPPPLDALDMKNRQRFDFGAISLLGHDRYRRGFGHAPDTPIKPGDLLHVTFYWRANVAPRADWWFELSLSDSSGKALAPMTAPLVSETYLTTMWQGDEIVRGEHDLLIPADLPPDTYRLSLTLLPDQETPAGSAYLGTVRVEKP